MNGGPVPHHSRVPGWSTLLGLDANPHGLPPAHPHASHHHPARRPPPRRPALLAYTGVRTTGLLALTLWSHIRDQDVWQALAAEWDTEWYLGIAAHGYTTELGTRHDANNLAFFPLYPLLLRAVTPASPSPPPPPA
ncbi:hypothetical protein [Streptomyces sp. TRM70350]|uniref:hypothetical protein n=1 Tax=Streptomyces sp. TRM70350 TaxID=2856165 RepID=UPI001C4626E1|nr:hypothetical protein [Streptomyces sp. TRM70350]